MTYEQANSVKHLTPEMYEVMKRLDVECSKCRSEGRLDIQGVSFPKLGLQCDKCNGTGKVKWKWQPQTGNWVYCRENGKVVCLYYNKHHGNPPEKYTNPKTAIPILEWEVIEGVLEKAGFRMEEPFGATGGGYGVTIRKRGILQNNGFGKSRLLTVYKAVIALGKEIKK